MGMDDKLLVSLMNAAFASREFDVLFDVKYSSFMEAFREIYFILLEDDDCQDAQFVMQVKFAKVPFNDPLPKRTEIIKFTNAMNAYPTLVFSQFGKFTTIHDAEGVLNVEELLSISKSLEQHGFICLPERLLTEKICDSGNDTWYDMFFGYM